MGKGGGVRSMNGSKKEALSMSSYIRKEARPWPKLNGWMKKRARVDFKSSCSAYPPTFFSDSGGHKNIRTAYSFFKALLYLIKWKQPALTNKKEQSLSFCYLLLLISSVYLNTRQAQERIFNQNRAIALSKQGSPLLYGSHLLVYFSSCVYRYRPILSQLPILYRWGGVP